MIHNYLRRTEPISTCGEMTKFMTNRNSSEPLLNLLVLKLMGCTHLYSYKIPFKFNTKIKLFPLNTKT